MHVVVGLPCKNGLTMSEWQCNRMGNAAQSE
jgi:hypothetical protein